MAGWSILLAFSNASSRIAWTTDRILAFVLAGLLILLSIGLLLAAWTRWGQSKPLTKCIVLSILAHLWLLMYAYSFRVDRPGYGPGQQANLGMEAQWVDETSLPYETPLVADSADSTPLDQTEFQQEAQPEPPSNEMLTATNVHAIEPEQSTSDKPVFSFLPQELPDLLVSESAPPSPEILSDSAPDFEAPVPTEWIAESPSGQDKIEQAVSETDLPDEPKHQVDVSTPIQFVQQTRREFQLQRERPIDRRPIPEVYQLRDPENRQLAVTQFGGDESTEAAVEAALAWLAKNQEPDGFWDAKRHGAGSETKTLGEDRNGTGRDADTAMTGLALLSFLGAGHTHLQGTYRETVRKAASYLMRVQMPSGDLAGPKQVGNDRSVYFARMYSHGMATLALAELYAMTGDADLVPVLSRAAEYSVRAQNPSSGGWRYALRDTGDPGDLSQFGWQAMALNSCMAGGFQFPSEIRGRMTQFLDAVKSGRHGGLAVYRPVPGQQASVPMTAEALASRLLLGLPLPIEAEAEAKAFILRELPGQSQDNFYCWYYATIALFQYQDESWRKWNEALKSRLINTQRPDGNELAGSWDNTCLWSGYGGRVYSTAMACLCLEVYYRYLPMYRHDQIANRGGLAR